jgi:hypothetical protein
MDIILELKQNPDSRRVVLAMWDGGSRADWTLQTAEPSFRAEQPGDFYAAISGSNDVPCNTHAYFDTVDGKLNMTVCCRSNDIIWGAYGANAVHFSFLLEFLATASGIPMGVYRQFSNNFHIYTNIVAREMMMPMARDVEATDKYLMRESPNALRRVPVEPPMRKVPLMQTALDNFEFELANFMAGAFAATDYTEPFFNSVAIPMYDRPRALSQQELRRGNRQSYGHQSRRLALGVR